MPPRNDAPSQLKDGRPVAGIVLAAGRSTRMGRTKQRIALGDKTLLQHVIANALAAGLDPVIVVLGHEADAIRADIEASDDASRLHVVINAAYADGQSSSLRAGLLALGPEPEAAAILLADQPGVSPTLIRRVVASASHLPCFLVGTQRVLTRVLLCEPSRAYP